MPASANSRRSVLRSIAAVSGLAAAAIVAPGTAAAAAPTGKAKPTVVLVHGAWADGSSWNGVTERLQRAGYPTTVLANPLRGLSIDANYIRDYLSTVTGPIVLAGHSYGGAVITNAATGIPNVVALVYVDAFVPDQGETVLGLAGAMPGSALAVDPTTVFKFVPYPGCPGRRCRPVRAARRVPGHLRQRPAGTDRRPAGRVAARVRLQRRQRAIGRAGLADDPVLVSGRHRRQGHSAGRTTRHGPARAGAHRRDQRVAPGHDLAPGHRRGPDPTGGTRHGVTQITP
jgi:pimeloyl-ACP methyl ester carboxylesterase